MKHSTYIEPFFTTHNSYTIKDFFQDGNYPEKRINFHPINKIDLINKQYLFVLGEPGFGKSRLLKELFEEKKLSGSCAFIDIKDAKDGIINLLTNPSKHNEDNSIFQDKLKFKLSPSFKLKNSKKVAIFLDALDEVHTDIIPTFIDEVREIQKSYPKISIFVSCRSHHITRYEDHLKESDFDCCIIAPLILEQVVQFIKLNCKELSNVSDYELSNKVKKYYSPNSIHSEKSCPLNTPRYLEIFIKLIDSNIAFDEIIQLNRSELFDLFIDERLNKESGKRISDQKSYKQKIPYIKQAFQRIALVLEIQRENKISKDDLASFEMDANINLSNQIPLEVFYDGTLLKDNGDYLEFDNTEFQEYLASKALLQIGKLEQTIFDIAIDQKLKLVYESWINVLGFLVEQYPSILAPLVKLGCREQNPNLFFLIFYPNHRELEIQLKSEIFLSIINYLIKYKKWFWNNITNGLSFYFVPKLHNENLFKLGNQKYDHKQYLIRILIADVLNSSLQKGINLSSQETENWKNYYLNQHKTSLKYGTVFHRHAIRVLSNLCSTEELRVYDNLINQEHDIFVAAIDFHTNSDPNHPTSIERFIEYLEKGEFSFISPINAISTKQGFKLFFQKIIILMDKNKHHFLEKIESDVFERKFLHRLKPLINDDELLVLVYTFLIEYALKTVYKNRNVLHLFIEMLRDIKINFEIEIANIIASTPKYYQNPYNLGILLSKIILFTNLSKVEKILQKLTNGKEIMQSILFNSTDNKIVNHLIKSFPKIDKNIKAEKQVSKNLKKSRELNKTRRIEKNYDELSGLINKKDLRAVQLFYTKPEVAIKATPSQKKNLKKIIVTHLDKYDPINVKYNSGYLEEDFHNFYYGVLLFNELEISPTSYRNKLLDILPYSNGTDQSKQILKLIPNPTDEELKGFINRYFSLKSTELQKITISNIIELFTHLNIQDIAFRFLKKIIKDKAFDFPVKIEILKILDKQIKEDDYFIEVFDRYSKLENNYKNEQILLFLNEILLSRNNENAFNWRKNILFQKKKSASKSKKDLWSIEGIGLALSKITHEKFNSKMLDLLEESFKLLVKDKNNYSFVNKAIWFSIEKYFKSQIKNKENLMDNLNKLRNLTKKYASTQNVNYFDQTIEQIESEYLSFLEMYIPKRLTPPFRRFDPLVDNVRLLIRV